MQYSVPTVLSLLVHSLYIVVDRIFIGNIPEVGALALTGVGLTMPILTLILALSALIAMGAGSNISINLGKGKKEEAENTAGNAITLSVVIGFIIIILYYLFSTQIFDLLRIQDQTLLYAKEYITIIILGTVFNMIGFVFPFIVRADGNPRFSAAITITGCLLNIGLDALFIQVFHMGIKGAAIATVLSQFVTVVLGLSYFIKGKPSLELKKSNFKFYQATLKPIFLIGLVPFSNQLSISVAQIVSNYSLNLYGGELAIAAMTVLSSIAALFLMPVYGISQGFQPIVGFNYGRKLYDRALKTLILATVFSAAILGVGTLITQAFPEFLVGLFTQDSRLVDIAVKGIRKYTILLPLASIPIFGSAFMMLTGKPKTAALLSISRQSVILALTIFLLPRAIGQDGLWLAQPLTDILASIITIILFIKAYGHIMKKKPSNI